MIWILGLLFWQSCLAPTSPDGLAQDVWLLAFSDPSAAVTQVAPNGAHFDFSATSSGKTENYLLHSYPGPISGTLAIDISVATLSGTPVFNKDSDPSNTCDTAPAAHLFFTSASGGSDGNDFHRWWAKTGSYTLADGTATISMSLTPANWSSVFGKSGDLDSTTEAGFADALQNVRYIGMTFGGGCFYGHGVSVSGGAARLSVSDYSIQ